LIHVLRPKLKADPFREGVERLLTAIM
jgi:hypothetical protein